MYTYLFDFDGTLVDSMSVYASSMIKILDDNKIKYPKDIVKIITPLGVIGAAEYFVSLGVNLTVEEIILLMKKYMMDEYLHNIPAKNNVISALKTLKDRGACLNVLTASPHITLDVCLKRLEIYDLFSNIWSCDDFSTTKADPNIYKTVANKLGENIDNILFFDDNLNACKTAKSAGMKVCGVYDESSKEYTEQIKAVTDYYVDDFAQLLDIN